MNAICVVGNPNNGRKIIKKPKTDKEPTKTVIGTQKTFKICFRYIESLAKLIPNSSENKRQNPAAIFFVIVVHKWSIELTTNDFHKKMNKCNIADWVFLNKLKPSASESCWFLRPRITNFSNFFSGASAYHEISFACSKVEGLWWESIFLDKMLPINWLMEKSSQ